MGAAVLALALLGGCSLIVPSNLDHVKCSDPGAIGPPACGPGQVCGAGACVDCQKTDACGDGVDNDCNGVVDDGCGDGGTADGSVGKPCGQGGACPAGLFCLDPQAVLGQSGGPFCTRGCCTSAECGSGDAVCWPTSRGAAVCRRASEVGRGTPGSGADGSACGADADCRSGACGASGVCIDTCCSNGDCPAASASSCALGPIQNEPYDSFYCSASGAQGYQQPCNQNEDCQSRACINVGVGNLCSQPCCKSTDCGIAVGGLGFSCAYYVQNGVGTRLCLIPQGGTGSGATGAACAGDADCRSGKCLDVGGGQKICSDACCRDSDCGNSKLGCRPVNSNGTYVLRCVPL